MKFFLLFSQALKLTTDKPKPMLKKKPILMLIAIVVVIALLIFVAAVIGWTIYRCSQKNDKSKYDACRTNEPPISMESLKDNIKKQPSQQQPTVGPYPEPHADL
jgi:flagellar basal body-associated protein FliL